MDPLLIKAIDGLNVKLATTEMTSSIRIDIRDLGSIYLDDTGARQISTDVELEVDIEADCTLKASPKTFQGLLDGSVNAKTAVMLGKLKIHGDIGAALKLATLLG